LEARSLFLTRVHFVTWAPSADKREGHLVLERPDDVQLARSAGQRESGAADKVKNKMAEHRRKKFLFWVKKWEKRQNLLLDGPNSNDV
jgi:hypothetical protein